MVWENILKNLPDNLPSSNKTVNELLSHIIYTPSLPFLPWQVNLDYIEGVSQLAVACLGDTERKPSPALQKIVIMLHDTIFELEFESSAQEAVVRMCETWYLNGFERNDEVVPQTVLYLLMRSVGANGRLVDVKRVFAMREAFQLLEVGVESFRSVQEALMRAVVHPNYIMHDEGRRFLAVVLSLHPQLTLVLHKSIKSLLPRCRSVVSFVLAPVVRVCASHNPEGSQKLDAGAVRGALPCRVEAKRRPGAAGAGARLRAGPGEPLHPRRVPSARVGAAAGARRVPPAQEVPRRGRAAAPRLRADPVARPAGGQRRGAAAGRAALCGRLPGAGPRRRQRRLRAGAPPGPPPPRRAP